MKNQGFQICTKVDADDKVFPILLTNLYFLEPHRNIDRTKTTTPPDYHNDDCFSRPPDDLIKISVVFEGRLIVRAF